MNRGRVVVAGLVTLVAGPFGLWAGLVAAATLLGQVLAGFGVITNADLAQVFNPAVWFGLNNIAGTGSLLDSLVGGPGAPGGTVNRYIVFMLMGFIAAICYAVLKAVWTWATEKAAPPLSESGV